MHDRVLNTPLLRLLKFYNKNTKAKFMVNFKRISNITLY